MRKRKIEFYAEYLVNTFEAIVVALVIATLAVTGMYPLFFVPTGLLLSVLYILVRYKRFKDQTDSARETRQLGITDEAQLDKLKNELFSENENEIPRRINRYGFSSALLLAISIILVWLIPFYAETKKEQASAAENKIVLQRIHSLTSSVDALKDSLSQMIQMNRPGTQERPSKLHQTSGSPKPLRQ